MTVSSRLRLAILERDGHRCVYCGETSSSAILHVDHVIPRKLGGPDRPDNLVAACFACNNAKRATPIAVPEGVLGRPMPEWWNKRRSPTPRVSKDDSTPDGSHVYEYWGRHGGARRGPLWLYAELNLSAVLGEAEPDEDDIFDFYVDYVRRSDSDAWQSDAVSIGWTVMPVMEFAPFVGDWYENFLTFYSWPVDVKTGDLLDWFQLPVVLDRFDGFEKALAWKPAALQPTAPIRSLWECRNAISWGRQQEVLDASPYRLNRKAS